MKIAIVTPYFNEKIAVLTRCHDSVKNQTVPVDHFMISDGNPHPAVDKWNVFHTKLPIPHKDYGDTPRFIGGTMARNLGYDGVLFLDADNWFEPTHVEKMVELYEETGAKIVTATRNLVRMDGSFMKVCDESNGEEFCDTNCMFIPRSGFDSFPIWAYKDMRYSLVGDRVYWAYIVKQKYSKAHYQIPTVNYTASAASFYIHSDETPPDEAYIDVAVEGVEQRLSYIDFLTLKKQGKQIVKVDKVKQILRGV
jgi:glycosyltransferase involved in cell wall biosynthesis